MTFALIETGDMALSKIMQGIQQSFTQNYNIKHDRTGHVFQQRYKATLVDGDSYLLQLVKYIHRNPVKAWMKEGLNYKWSSHQDYLKVNTKSVVEVEFVLKMLGKVIKRGLKEYKRFMNLEQGKLDIKEFTFDEEELYATLEEVKEMKTNSPNNKYSVMQIIKCVSVISNMSLDEITKKSKNRKHVNARKAIVILCSKYAEITNIELGKILNISPSVIARIKGEGTVSQEVKRMTEDGIALLQS
ncbi:hypothetical protein HYG86_00170 [Alkalicella caledoniensis]|uniref:Transposase IS200-like domain-containing protein n=1 Tax=Alkalicella caledoniensis TaxID=2731377 RepID=A0A7G9W3P1_ALKCA|nr:hypothetical protein [Alkalicella caledoniensis]QNO13303.1 hypothetical protein HYG86_00170 [Alkalicella caledoniensis]